MDERRVVVTGLGTVNPLGNSVHEFWENLKKGKSGIRRLPDNFEEYYIKIGGTIDLPDVREYFASPKMIKRLDRYIIYSQVAAMQALCDSGLDTQKNPWRIGAFIGTGSGGLQAHERNQEQRVASGLPSMAPMYVINAIPNTGSALFCQEAGIRGSSYSVNSACATGNHAIGTAFLHIKSGILDVAFAGGVEAALSSSGIGAFGNLSTLSTTNDSPETASRPFDKDRNGFILSDGAGVLCVEELEHAKKRGAKIYAEILSYASTSDAHDFVAPHPEARSTTYAIKECLKNGKVSPEKIGFVNCHGTSTQIGDRVESLAIMNAFGEYGKEVPVHSTKSMTGHTIGAAGGIEAIAGIMAFEEGVVHLSANCYHQDPEIPLNVIKETREDIAVETFISNSFGFGGHNAILLFSKI